LRHRLCKIGKSRVDQAVTGRWFGRKPRVEPEEIAFRGSVVALAQAQLIDQLNRYRLENNQAVAAIAVNVALATALTSIRASASQDLLISLPGLHYFWWAPLIAFAASVLALFVTIRLNQPNPGPDALTLAATLEREPVGERLGLMVVALEYAHRYNRIHHRRTIDAFMVGGIALLAAGVAVCGAIIAGVG